MLWFQRYYVFNEQFAEGKELLYSELGKLVMDNLPRIKRRQGDNRGEKDCKDLIEYMTRADEQGLLSTPPT